MTAAADRPVDNTVDCAIDRERHVAVLTLDRPGHGNALTVDMVADFCDRLTELEADDDVKAIVIAGRGADFCTGAEPTEVEASFRRMPGGEGGRIASLRSRLIAADELWWGPRGLFGRLMHCRKITIALPEGACRGAGAYFALFADLAIAGDSARFAFPRWRHVGVDGDISMLIAAVGLKRAKEFIYCGAEWDAPKAARCGLVDAVVPCRDLAEAGRILAAVCATIMRDAIVAEKQVVFASLAKMQVAAGFAMASVVAGWGSNIHFRPGEFNFLRALRDGGLDSARDAARRHFDDPASEPTSDDAEGA